MGTEKGDPRRPLSITARRWSDQGATLTIVGELDIAEAATLRRAVQVALATGRRQLVLDLSSTTFLDCAALRELLLAIRPLQDRADAAVVFACANGIVRRLLQVLDFDGVIGNVESTEVAIAACRLSPSPLPDGWRRAWRTPEVRSVTMEA